MPSKIAADAGRSAASLGVVGIDPLVLFFEGDSQGENLALGEAVKFFIAHDIPRALPRRARYIEG